jgi:hypothetical protein
MGNVAYVRDSHSRGYEDCVSWVIALCSSGTASYGFALLIANTILAEEPHSKRPLEVPNCIWEDDGRGNVKGVGTAQK